MLRQVILSTLTLKLISKFIVKEKLLNQLKISIRTKITHGQKRPKRNDVTTKNLKKIMYLVKDPTWIRTFVLMSFKSIICQKIELEALPLS